MISKKILPTPFQKFFRIESLSGGLLDSAKSGVIAGSVLAGLAGYLVLRLSMRMQKA